MSDFWYVARNGQAVGPFTTGQLQEQVAGRQLAPADLVAAAGSSEWVPAVTVPDLFVVQPVAPPGPRVVQATCLGCFAAVQIEVPAGSSSGNCPACGAENQFAEPAREWRAISRNESASGWPMRMPRPSRKTPSSRGSSAN